MEIDPKVLDSLVESHQQTKIKYAWDEDFQRSILGMLLCDRFFITQSLGLIKPEYFTNEIHEVVSRLLYAYFEKHKQLPSKIFLRQMISDKLSERYKNQDIDTFNTAKLLYVGELNTLYDYYSKGGGGDMIPGLDSPDAVLDYICAFAKTQALKSAFHKCLEIVRQRPDADQTWVTVDEMLRQARSVERQSDMGLNYFDDFDDRYARMANNKENEELYSFGFPSVDEAGGKLSPGEIGAVMSLPGCGKSLTLSIASIKNIAQGKKVLYISTEMDQDRVAARFDAQISLVGHHELMLKKEDVRKALQDFSGDYEDKRRLIIKQFPSGTADVNTVKAFHAQCVMSGFKPGLVIVDYLGDMKDAPGLSVWESKFRILRDLRGFGGIEKHATLTAIQPNRSSKELGLEDFMDEGQQGSSFMQNQVLDVFLTINQTNHERRAGVGRVFSAKIRNGRSRFGFKIKYNYETQTLNLEEISDETYRVMMARVKNTDADAVNDKIDKTISRNKNKKFEPTEGESA